MNELVNPLEPFKFWARKPLDIANAYLKNYAKGRQVLLDPFAGTGIFVFAGLLNNMKVIYNDLSSYALFLARNAIKPVNPKIIQERLNEVLNRKLPFDIKTKDGSIIIKKGSKIEDVINWFYESRCNCKDGKKICNRNVNVEYFIWDTVYYVPQKLGEKYALKKLSEKDERYKIFFDIICKKEEIEVDGKKLTAFVFSRRDINEKWEKAFEANPKAWITRRERGRKEASAVNEVPANIIRIGLAKRYRREPILKKFNCVVHGDQLTYLDQFDIEKIKLIENLIYPFPNLIPNNKLTYVYNGKEVPYLQFREFQTFVEESLSTIEKNEWKDRIPRFKHYFTKRNLIALTILLWSMMQIDDDDDRDQMYLLFVSNLHMDAKFDRKGPLDGWATGYYASLDDFKENNILVQLFKGWNEIKKLKEWLVKFFNSKLSSITYDETWDPKEFLNHINEPGKKNILWLRKDAKDIDSIINRRVVDVIFTDPPYRGEAFSVQYFELTSFFVAWLVLDKRWKQKYGDLEWWKDEIIDNKSQGKDVKKYLDMLKKAFLAIDNITKRDAIWIITYHSPSKNVWEGIKGILEECSLKLPPYEKVMTQKIGTLSGGSFYIRKYGSVGEDAYIVLSKEERIVKETIEPVKKLSKEEFLKLVLEKMKKEIVKEGGIVTWSMFLKNYPDIVLRYGGPYGESESYKDLFEDVTIELADDLRILDRDKIGDELFKMIYYSIDENLLIRKILVLYGSKRKEIPRSELDFKILPKINGRIDDFTKVKILKEIFYYLPIENKYIFKPQAKTLKEFLLKAEIKEIEKALPMPPELIFKIKEISKRHGGHIVKELSENFSLAVFTSNYQYLININDEAGIRRFIMSSKEKERIDKVIVYVNYATKESSLHTLAKQLFPAIFIVIPYEKYNDIIEAFKKYDPLENLKKYIVRGK